MILSSWVGYDTDGRTDIGWWDTLRLRLEMKRLQLARLHAQIAALPGNRGAGQRASPRRSTPCDAQIAACPDRARAGAGRRFAHALVGRREDALTSPRAAARRCSTRRSRQRR